MEDKYYDKPPWETLGLILKHCPGHAAPVEIEGERTRRVIAAKPARVDDYQRPMSKSRQHQPQVHVAFHAYHTPWCSVSYQIYR